MSKLSEYMFGTEELDHPSDVETIKEKVPALACVPPSLVQKMWRDYSDTMAAGWLIVDDDEIEHFKRWLY